MAGEVKRAVRVAEGIREELALLLLREVRDPRVANALVSRVELTDDLRTARVYVRALEGGEKPERRAELLTGFGKAAGLLRREITRRLSLRSAPEFRFFYDEGVDKANRIERLLIEVKDEERARAL